MAQTPPPPVAQLSPARRLLPLVLPALVVGIASSLILLGVSSVAALLEDVLWTDIPQAMGMSGNTPLWIMLILTLTGVLVGLIVWKAPGHAGPDPATLGLVEAPLPLTVLPSLLVALILMLAGGVSLGPENPIMGVAIGLVFAIGTRIMPRVTGEMWVGLATAGMLGAMFGRRWPRRWCCRSRSLARRGCRSGTACSRRWCRRAPAR